MNIVKQKLNTQTHTYENIFFYQLKQMKEKDQTESTEWIQFKQHIKYE